MLQLFKVSTYACLLFTSDKTTVNTHVCYYSLMTFQLEKFKLLLSYNYGSTFVYFFRLSVNEQKMYQRSRTRANSPRKYVTALLSVVIAWKRAKRHLFESVVSASRSLFSHSSMFFRENSKKEKC